MIFGFELTENPKTIPPKNILFFYTQKSNGITEEKEVIYTLLLNKK